MAQSELSGLTHLWARGIQQVLYRSTVPFRFVAAVRGPQVFTFRLALQDAAQLSKALSLGEQFALQMQVDAVRVARSKGLVDVEVPMPRSLRKPLPARALAQPGGTRVTLGQTGTGIPVRIDLAGNGACHGLIAGTTGSGKTVTEQLVAWALANGNDPSAVRLILIDGKGGVHWRGFEREAHLCHPVIADTAEAVAALGWAVAELDRRKRNGQQSPRIFVVVDEVRELIALGGTAIGEAICQLTSLGRELGLHLLLATQYPVAEALGGTVAKANLPLRLVGRMLNASDAYVASGVKDSGAETLAGNGDFLAAAGGALVRVQVGMATHRELYQLPRAEGEPSRLDLAAHNLDRALVATAGLQPEHLALALATNRGSRWLSTELRIGGDRAGRLRRFAIAVLRRLEELGFEIVALRTAEGDRPQIALPGRPECSGAGCNEEAE